MATEHQIQANRANALKSTGPVTQEGKRTSSRNGAPPDRLSGTVVLRNESSRRFNGLVEAIMLEFRPRTATETALVQTMATARWHLLRMWGMQTAGFEHEMARRPPSAGTGAVLAAATFRALADNSRVLALGHRMEVGYDRQYHRALSMLLKLREIPNASPDPTAPEVPPIHLATEAWDDLEVDDLEIPDLEVPDLEVNDSEDGDPGDGDVGGLAERATRPPFQPSPVQPSPVQSSPVQPSEDAAAPDLADRDSKDRTGSASPSKLAETPSVSAEHALFQGDALFQDAPPRGAPPHRPNSEMQPKPIPSPRLNNISAIMNGLRSKTACAMRSTRTQSGRARSRNGAATRTAAHDFIDSSIAQRVRRASSTRPGTPSRRTPFCANSKAMP